MCADWILFISGSVIRLHQCAKDAHRRPRGLMDKAFDVGFVVDSVPVNRLSYVPCNNKKPNKIAEHTNTTLGEICSINKYTRDNVSQRQFNCCLSIRN